MTSSHDHQRGSDTMSGLPVAVGEIIARFEALSAVRDRAVTDGRTLVRLAANAIRALHRGEDATSHLAEARALKLALVTTTADHPSIYWAGYTQDAMKEYAEAEITAALLREEAPPTADALGVEDAAWMNGLAEAASELRRDVLDALRTDEIARAERLLQAMDAIYGVLVTVDFPDAVTGGLRRTTDQFRAVLERTRGDVTVAVRQSRLEHALREAERRAG
jgi:translin